jgi:hypothetical protein
MIFLIGVFLGILVSSLFVYVIYAEIIYLQERNDYWYKTAMEYLHMLCEEKNKKEEEDTTDWWKK